VSADGGGCALTRELDARARRWALELTGDPARVIDGERFGDAVSSAFAVSDAPVLVAWPQLPAWRADHAEAVLDDLADGCAVSLGPMFDGGFYLVALAHPVPSLLALDDAAWTGTDPIGLAAQAAQAQDTCVGLLRTERGLRTAADVAALLADPLLDQDLRALLG
jgi:glycosyltransferase A (GT-A) superfamily protein (DUF2064 family)